MTVAGAETYDRVSQALHWVLAALILFLIYYHPSTEEGHGIPTDLEVTLHASLGVLVLVLSLARLTWRLCCARVPPPAPAPPWQERLRRTVYVVFYAGMVLAPVLGLVLALASELEVVLFAALEVPRLIHDPQAGDLLRSLHGLAGDILLYLAIVHLGAALYHQFRLKDGLLRRMAG